MLLSDFDYDLPDDLIAQHPMVNRRASRMMVMRRSTGDVALRTFADFPSFVKPGDCLVVNDTRVIPARLHGAKSDTGGKVEALLTREISPGVWHALLKPGKRLKPGTEVEIDTDRADRVTFTVIAREEDGSATIRFSCMDVSNVLNRYGHIPLPPYIRRDDTGEDADRYQTVYGTNPGAIAAPTAGLHFDRDILEQLEARSIRIVRLTLHVGIGTFKTIATEHIEDHNIHQEYYDLPPKSAAIINDTKQSGGAIVAIGTTTVRVLESCANPDHTVSPDSGFTTIYLHPPYRPKIPDMLLTNFHLPRSSLLVLLCCFASRQAVLDAYRTAVRERFRFYSYGDCMLLKN